MIMVILVAAYLLWGITTILYKGVWEPSRGDKEWRAYKDKYRRKNHENNM